MDQFTGTREVAASHAFDVAALQAHLQQHLPDFAGPLTGVKRMPRRGGEVTEWQRYFGGSTMTLFRKRRPPSAGRMTSWAICFR